MRRRGYRNEEGVEEEGFVGGRRVKIRVCGRDEAGWEGVGEGGGDGESGGRER